MFFSFLITWPKPERFHEHLLRAAVPLLHGCLDSGTKVDLYNARWKESDDLIVTDAVRCPFVHRCRRCGVSIFVCVLVW